MGKNAVLRAVTACCLFLGFLGACAQKTEEKLTLGAERFDVYGPGLAGQRVALVVNQTSEIHGVHLVDMFLAKGVEVVKVFAPEHGFRGKADAGEKVNDATDAKTGLPIVSLYGKNKKPSAEMLSDVDVVVFDIQDVGVRFYTYISTMHYVMEAVAEQEKRMIVLDRPNPNGSYVDGPVLERGFESFVGMHPIPVVHGVTVGELAKMISGEKWLATNKVCDLSVVPMLGYSHDMPYSLPVKPSPNLPDEVSVRLYPSLCFFEGTPVSAGRGTERPFTLYGYPDKAMGEDTFRPRSILGMSKYPKHEGKLCYGENLADAPGSVGFKLEYLLRAYKNFPDKKKFFNSFFDKLAGTDKLKAQISAGMDEKAIRTTWAPALEAYGKMRKGYLIYE
ncbi:hypothetical protein FUAX_05520 [Fulvitalea axinellae]|uniref:FHA domain-containing protein n=1 Tax=Fulvitalea axinellae TaxID=1182444 RepID=A0AAU9CFZ0_9BACT|nr:hypothetical protein FUAX_05520 [Fulvitalea axinellae]